MKLNWGHYILISFVLFVGLIVYMVVRSFQHNNDLVAEDYYAQEINFQEVIDKKARAANLEEDIKWESFQGGIKVTYPAKIKDIKGNILLFRPSDKSKDVEFKINPDEKGQQFLMDESFIHGKYLIQIDWQSGDQSYYSEGTAYIIK